MRVTSQDILHDPIGPVLRRMTVPMIFGILSMFLFQAVDTYFISLLGTSELAAISFTFPVTFTVNSLTIGMSIAVSVIVGQAIGRGDHQQAARLTTDAILLSVLLVVVLSLAGLASVDFLFAHLGASAGTLLLIHDYIDIWYLFVFFLVIPMVGNSAIRATGDTKWPSILMIAAGLLNVILDPIFIFGWGPVPAMAMRGAAYATVVSWVLGTVVAIWLLWRRERLLLFSLPGIAELSNSWARLTKLGMPISLANMLTPITIGALTAMVAGFGEHAVAAFGAGGRIESFAMVVALALTSALSPYMAQNLGAGKPERAHRALMLSIYFILAFQFAMYALLALLAAPLGGIFSKDPAVVSLIKRYLWIMPAGTCMYSVVIVINTAFNANHRSSMTLLVSAVRLLVFVVPLAWIGAKAGGLPGLFAGAVAGNFITAGLSRWLYGRYRPDKHGSDGPAVEAAG